MGELAYGDAAVDGLLVLRIGHGVGAGLVVDGRLVGGRKGAAGEIGHVVVDPEGRPCACGRRGCLETLLAAPRLRAAVAEAGEDGRAQVLADLGRTLGIVLAPVAAALNLREIVLSGPPDLLSGPLADAAAATIAERTMPVIGGDLPVRVSSLGQDAQLLGAAGLVLAAELGVS
jgi:predicted NBD/HSP70 family sugar kinase